MTEVGAVPSPFSPAATSPETGFARGGDGGEGFDTLGFAALQTFFDGLWTALGASGSAAAPLTEPVSSVIGGAADDVLQAQSLAAPGSYFMRGGEGADSIIGAELADDINGNQGDDAVAGGGGGDWVLGGQGADLAAGGAGADLINGNRGADTLDGGEGADTVRGGQADDVVAGGAGDDELFGDAGSDTFVGGAGADIIHVGLREGRDVIDDFNRAEGDRIELDGIVEHSAEQAGADIRITLVYGSEAASYVTEVIVRNASLAAMTDGWIGGG